ncbi:S-methyl-5-thioribose kinase [Hirschia maritima]|uniref:S-methyl-5-thioribose kinase n=1 Tax=Hirschia maritima TaxID=1121961 RepID=UPI000362311C|nr:S-methyl-5-thioribose kinase [Hirschia maritima]
MYTTLTRETVSEYVLGLERCREILGEGGELTVSEIGDGNLNYVYRIQRSDDASRSVILKQSVPYLRMAGESWPLNKNRMLIEIKALEAYNKITPDFVPDIYYSDEEMCVLIMQDLGEVKVLRYSMIEGDTFSGLGGDIGCFLAKSLFSTSYLGMQSVERRELMQDFMLNDDLCKLTEEFIFTFPFIDHESNYQNREMNEYALKLFRNDREYLESVLHYKELFLSKTDALIHGDLHTGSLMAASDQTYVIDTEFAFFGPFGFDVGKIIANFLMSYTSHFYREGGAEFQVWVLKEIQSIWNVFEKEFLRQWNDSQGSALIYQNSLDADHLAVFKQNFMKRIFEDAIGFCACSLARRTIGIAGVADIRDIEDLAIRAKLEIMNIDLSHQLMRNRKNMTSIDELVSALEEFYANKTLEI